MTLENRISLAVTPTVAFKGEREDTLVEVRVKDRPREKPILTLASELLSREQ